MLVVDDDEVIRQLIAVNLTLEGFDVATAVDGQDCLDKVTAIDPDVITLDIMMPRLDGWMTASLLRRNPETSTIKVVLITARAGNPDVRSVMTERKLATVRPVAIPLAGCATGPSGLVTLRSPEPP